MFLLSTSVECNLSTATEVRILQGPSILRFVVRFTLLGLGRRNYEIYQLHAYTDEKDSCERLRTDLCSL